MTDTTTKKPLHVSTDDKAGPYIMVPVVQLEEVQRLLDTHGVAYLVEEEAISFNGSPEIAVMNLGRETDASKVQSILDSVR